VQGLQGAMFEIEDFVVEAATRENEPEVIETLGQAVDTSSRMVALFRAMRTFIRSGESAHRPCRVAQLVDRSVALCRGNLRSVVSLDIEVSATEEVQVNEALFLQVLVNVLKNAAEAAPIGSVVTIRSIVEEEDIVFSFCDEGPGVPKELQDDIFTPFVSTKNEHSASGLGLAISAEIMSEHKGSISYHTAKGGGAEFRVRVPRLVHS